MRRSRIVGLGSYVPEWVVKNDDLKQWMDTSDEWIQERTGIRERRWVKPGSGIGLYIVKEALNKIGGTINVESKYGEGTQFEIIIPNRNEFDS